VWLLPICDNVRLPVVRPIISAPLLLFISCITPPTVLSTSAFRLSPYADQIVSRIHWSKQRWPLPRYPFIMFVARYTKVFYWFSSTIATRCSLPSMCLAIVVQLVSFCSSLRFDNRAPVVEHEVRASSSAIQRLHSAVAPLEDPLSGKRPLNFGGPMRAHTFSFWPTSLVYLTAIHILLPMICGSAITLHCSDTSVSQLKLFCPYRKSLEEISKHDLLKGFRAILSLLPVCW